VVKAVAGSELCRRFLQIPGIGPVTALTVMTAIEDPSRSVARPDVAAYFGLTSRRWQSGTSIGVERPYQQDWRSGCSALAYEAAQALMTRYKGKDKVRAWGLSIAKRSCSARRSSRSRASWRVIHARHVDDGTFYIGDPMPTRKTPQRVPRARIQLLGDMHEHARITEMPLSVMVTDPLSKELRFGG